MKLLKTSLTSLIFILTLALPLNAGSMEKFKLDIDLDNDGETDIINSSLESKAIEIYKRTKQDGLTLMHKFYLEAVKVSNINQYNVVSMRNQKMLGQDVASAFEPQYKKERIRYHATQSVFFKNKFLIMDVNNDGNHDFIQIENPSYLQNTAFYQHVIHLQQKDNTFSKMPDKIIKENSSSWISGIYQDINKDGFPDKIEVKYKRYGALLSKTKCVINIYVMRKDMEKYEEKPTMRVVSSGLFHEDINFRDIDKNGYPDIVIAEIHNRPTSLSDAISKILDRQINIVLKFYLFNKTSEKYPSKPSFTKTVRLNAMKELFMSLDNDFNKDGYQDLLVSQNDYSKKYLFDYKNLTFE